VFIHKKLSLIAMIHSSERNQHQAMRNFSAPLHLLRFSARKETWM
jgi:hypothetical protein